MKWAPKLTLQILIHWDWADPKNCTVFLTKHKVSLNTDKVLTAYVTAYGAEDGAWEALQLKVLS
jgi:hypothetical protein